MELVYFHTPEAYYRLSISKTDATMDLIYSDGATESRIWSSKDDLNTYIPTISDCNAATKSGNYACNNAANAPVAYGILKVETAMSGTWIFQTFRKASDSDISQVYMRDNINSTGWSQWTLK